MRSTALLLLAAFWNTVVGVKLRKIELDILKSSRPSLILFVANGCKECNRTQAVLDKASSLLSTTPIASVNCSEEPEACDESQVFSVPTLRFATGTGDLVPYKEALDESSIVRYIQRQSGPPVVPVNKDSYLDLAASSRIAVVATFGTSAGQEQREAFEAVAERWRAYSSFGAIDGTEAGSTEESSITVYFQERDDTLHYHGSFNVDDMETFLRDATTPLIHEFDPLVYDQLVQDGKPLAQVFLDSVYDRLDLVKSLHPLAKKYKGQMNFVTALYSDYNQQFEKLHLDKNAKHGFAITDERGRPYPMASTVLNADMITEHVESYMAGSLSPTIKSEPIPEPSEAMPFLKTLVGSNFDAIAYNKSQDVLVQFQVPWCEYCKESLTRDRLNKVMNELGAQYAELGLSELVTLATVNVDANDVPIRIDSYPSLRLYPAGTNGIVPFEGDFHKMLTVERLDTFISTHGGNRVSVHGRAKAHSEDDL